MTQEKVKHKKFWTNIFGAKNVSVWREENNAFLFFYMFEQTYILPKIKIDDGYTLIFL